MLALQQDSPRVFLEPNIPHLECLNGVGRASSLCLPVRQGSYTARRSLSERWNYAWKKWWN